MRRDPPVWQQRIQNARTDRAERNARRAATAKKPEPPAQRRRSALRAKIDDALHPAAFGAVLLILVSIGRLPEMVPPLAPLELGKIGVAMAMLGLLFGRRLNVAVFATRMGKLMMAFSALAVLSVGFSIWGSRSLEVLLTGFFISVLLFYLGAKSAGSAANYRLYVASLLGAAATLGLGAIILGPDNVGAETRAAVTTTYDPNDLALVLVTCLPFAAVRVFATHGGRRWAALAVTALLAVGVLATGSRGGFLGLLAVAGYLLFTQLPTHRRRFGFATKAAVVVIIGAMAIGLTQKAVWQRIATLGELGQDYNVSAETGRLAIWGRGLEIMATRPWGVGLAVFGAAEGQHGGKYKEAHNALIQVGSELGIAGLLVYLGFYATAFRSLVNRGGGAPPENGAPPGEWRGLESDSMALRTALVGFFITSFFLSQGYSPLFFLLLGLTVATALRRQALLEQTAPLVQKEA